MTMKTPSINSSSIWFAPSSSTSTLKSVQSAKTNTNNGNASPRSVSAEIDKQALARNLLAAALPVHPDSDDLSVGRTKIQLGEARAALGDWKRAHHLWNEALDIQHERLGSTHTLVADTLSRRAVARSKMGMFHEAIMDLEKALQIQQSLAEKKTNAKDLRLSILTILSELGSIQQKNNHLVEANRNFEAALLIANDVYGEKSREKIADIHCLIGKLYHQRRWYYEANDSFRQAVGLYKASRISKSDKRLQRAEHYLARGNRTAVSRSVWDC